MPSRAQSTEKNSTTIAARASAGARRKRSSGFASATAAAATSQAATLTANAKRRRRWRGGARMRRTNARDGRSALAAENEVVAANPVIIPVFVDDVEVRR